MNYDYATGAIPIIGIDSKDMSLTNAQFRALQNQTNSPFHLYGDAWIRPATGLTIGIAILVSISIALQTQPNAILVGLNNTQGSGAVMFVFASFLLANLGQPFNLPLAAGAAIATSMGTSMLLWFRRDRLAKLVTAFTSGAIVLGTLWYAFLIGLLVLGFVD